MDTKEHFGCQQTQISSKLQALYNATRCNTVSVITGPGLGSEMVIFL